MTINLADVAVEERGSRLDAIVNGEGTASLDYLDRLRRSSLPILREIVDGIDAEFGLRSQISLKKDQTAREKCSRPSTLEKYPWFTLAHIRDYLRFRSLLFRASDFHDVIEYFVEMQRLHTISIVKIDTAKLERPGAFGWRMIAIDMRISETGLLVEHYMTFREMIEINEAWLHKVYEAWRSRSTDDMTVTELADFERDALFSRHAYRELLFDGILRDQPRSSTLAPRRRALESDILKDLEATISMS